MTQLQPQPNQPALTPDAPPPPPAARAILDEILAAKKIAIVGHENPDLDCWGAEVAAARVFTQHGIECRIANSDRLIDRYDILDHAGTRRDFTPGEATLDVDGVLCLDCATFKRLGAVSGAFPPGKPVWNVDHHISNDRYGTKLYIPDDRTASCEILAELFYGMGWTVDKETARALYAGILTDTGCFVFRNVRPRTMRLAARLIENDFDMEAIYRTAYLDKTPEQIALEARAMAHLKSEMKGRLVYTFTTLADYTQAGVGVEATNEFPNIPRAIKGADLALYFYEIKPGLTKLSSRAVGQIDVSAMCKQFGGGGHRAAAGASFAGDAQFAMNQVLPVARALMGGA
ncbi:MAG: DHH family phosphoesterase [Planctomycetota bacterium]